MAANRFDAGGSMEGNCNRPCYVELTAPQICVDVQVVEVGASHIFWSQLSTNLCDEHLTTLTMYSVYPASSTDKFWDISRLQAKT
jgi:hypothetical protein